MKMLILKKPQIQQWGHALDYNLSPKWNTMVRIDLVTLCKYVDYIYDMTWNNPTPCPTCSGYLIR